MAKKLTDFADLVLDTGAPIGDSMIQVDGMEMPVSPGSTVGGCAVVNAIKCEVAKRLTSQGEPPMALVASNVAGSQRCVEVFEAAYDEHARRIAKLYANLGNRELDGKNAT